MALDPSISLGVKQLEAPNLLAQYGQIAAIQNARNQNALAQYQLSTEQRKDASTNALNAAYQAAYNPATGEIDVNKLRSTVAASGFGSELPGIEKTLLEGQKARTELVDAKLKQSRAFLDTLDPTDPNAPQQYMAWHQANHADPVLGPALAARGVTADQSMTRIQQAIAAGPQAFAQLINQSKLGTEKFMELNKPTTTSQNLGGQVRLIQTPGLGGASTVVPGSTAATTMSPYEQARLGQEQTRLDRERQGVVYQQDASGNIVALPSRLSPGEMPVARVAQAPGAAPVAGAPAAPAQPLQAKPSEAVQKEKLAINQQVSQLDGALDAVKAAPTAFGVTRGIAGSTRIGESLAGRMDTEAERTARSYVYNVISAVIKERAGTAQSASELANLNRFLPGEFDNADQVRDKIKGFKKYLEDRRAGTTTKNEPVAPPSGIPQGAIDALKAGKGTDAQFDEIFGAGAAKRARGQ
mgnify:CR=1 FL=1